MLARAELGLPHAQSFCILCSFGEVLKRARARTSGRLNFVDRQLTSRTHNHLNLFAPNAGVRARMTVQMAIIGCTYVRIKEPNRRPLICAVWRVYFYNTLPRAMLCSSPPITITFLYVAVDFMACSANANASYAYRFYIRSFLCVCVFCARLMGV